MKQFQSENRQIDRQENHKQVEINNSKDQNVDDVMIDQTRKKPSNKKGKRNNTQRGT
jgi:hypothetical protein